MLTRTQQHPQNRLLDALKDPTQGICPGDHAAPNRSQSRALDAHDDVQSSYFSANWMILQKTSSDNWASPRWDATLLNSPVMPKHTSLRNCVRCQESLRQLSPQSRMPASPAYRILEHHGRVHRQAGREGGREGGRKRERERKRERKREREREKKREKAREREREKDRKTKRERERETRERGEKEKRKTERDRQTHTHTRTQRDTEKESHGQTESDFENPARRNTLVDPSPPSAAKSCVRNLLPAPSRRTELHLAMTHMYETNDHLAASFGRFASWTFRSDCEQSEVKAGVTGYFTNTAINNLG